MKRLEKNGSEQIELEARLRERETFWLYGGKWCGKSHLVDELIQEVREEHSDRPQIRVIRLDQEMGLEEWAEALFYSVGGSSEERVGGEVSGRAEEIWKLFCAQYKKVADEYFVILDGWQWMPGTLADSGWNEIGKCQVQMGVISRGSALYYLDLEELAEISMIECPVLGEEDEEEAIYGELLSGLSEVKRALAVELKIVGKHLGEETTPEKAKQLFREVHLTIVEDILKGLSEEVVETLVVLSHMKRSVSRSRFWRYFDRRHLKQALARGLIYEEIDNVSIYPVIINGIGDAYQGRRSDWESLLHLLEEQYVETKEPEVWWSLLDAFAAAGSMATDARLTQEFLGHIFSTLDKDFAPFLRLNTLGDLLANLEKIAPMQMRGLPDVRFRYAQCLTLAGREREARRILDGLLSMDKTDAGKRAFLWKWMQAAHTGEVEDAIRALTDFIESRVEPGEPMDVTARLVLSRILISRGYYRKVLPIAEMGVRRARANASPIDLELLRNHYGVCLSFLDDLEAGLTLMREACDALQTQEKVAAHAEARHTLAWVCCEHQYFEEARIHINTVKKIYEELDDSRNLKLVALIEVVISLSAANEGDPREERDIQKLMEWPTGEYWYYFEGEKAFVRGLLAKGDGQWEEAIRFFLKSLQVHIDGGSIQVVARVLREVVPLILGEMSFETAREVLDGVDLCEEVLREQSLGELEDDIVQMIWLTGDLGRYNRLFQGQKFLIPDGLFPALRESQPGVEIRQWARMWEAAIKGEKSDFEPFRREGTAVLGGLHQALEGIWNNDRSQCCRGLFLGEDLKLEGSLFGFLRGMAQAFCCRPGEPNQWRAEMIAFWRGLSPMALVHQLNWWENLLDSTSREIPPRWRELISSWVSCVHQWRVEGAMLVDGESGTVILGSKEEFFDINSKTFSLLKVLARQENRGEPIGMSELFEEVWERSFNPSSSKNNIYVAIRALRDELSALGAEGSVEVVRGEGYRLSSPVVWVPGRGEREEVSGTNR